jgi:hypothetical protein
MQMCIWQGELPEVFRECTCRAASQCTGVLIHSCIESVSSHDLMNVGRREPSGLNKRIKALDAQRGAAEAKRCLGRRNKSRDLEESHLD